MSCSRPPVFALLASALLASGCGGVASAPARPGSVTELSYKALPYGSPVTSETMRVTVALLEQRLERSHIAASVSSSGDQITIRSSTRQAAGARALETSPTLYFYDWEPNVIGPNGEPTPYDQRVTGGQAAASAEAGITEYEAVERALKRKPVTRENDTTYEAGCTPAQQGGCIYGSWYLVDETTKKVLRGPEGLKASLYGDKRKVPPKDKIRAVRVNPGTVLARAQPFLAADGKAIDRSPESWYVLDDNPALTGTDIENPRQSFAGNSNGRPDVVFEFTASGRKSFERMTRQVAQRGQSSQLPGVSKLAAVQHFAVVLDNQVIAAPSIDFTVYPEGIDGSNGSQISGGFTLASARNLAERLRATLPVRLVLRALTTHFG